MAEIRLMRSLRMGWSCFLVSVTLQPHQIPPRRREASVRAFLAGIRPCAAINGHEDRDDAVAQGGIERPCSPGRGRLRVQVLPASLAPALAHHRGKHGTCSTCSVTVRGQYLETEMPTGTMKWFNPTKGYGFIQPSGGGGKDVFVHISAVERAGLRSLNEGQSIEYEIQSERGRQYAANLRVK